MFSRLKDLQNIERPIDIEDCYRNMKMLSKYVLGLSTNKGHIHNVISQPILISESRDFMYSLHTTIFVH